MYRDEMKEKIYMLKKEKLAIKEKIAELKKKKEKITLEIFERKNKLNSLDKEIMEIADILHDGLCKLNHTDGCSYYYSEWSDSELRPSRKKYYKMAKILKEYLKDIGHVEHNKNNQIKKYYEVDPKKFIKEFLKIIKAV